MKKMRRNWWRWAALLPAVFLFMHARPAQAFDLTQVFAQYTFAAQNLLTASVGASDTLKWTVKSIFENKVILKKSLEMDGTGIFREGAEVRARLKTTHLQVTDDAYLGTTRFDNLWIESKIRRDDGNVYIDDDLRINGDLNLQTASIGSSEITDGSIASADLAEPYQAEYDNVIVVGPVGTATENGTYLKNTFNAITGADATNTYLVKIEPGTYDVGTDNITMKSYVDIEGSGIDRTIVTTSRIGITAGGFSGRDNTEMRNFTLKCEPVSSQGICLTSNGYSPTIRDMKFHVNGSATTYGIKLTNSKSLIENVEIVITNSLGSGIGIDITGNASGEYPLLKQLYIHGAGSIPKIGIVGDTTQINLHNSRIEFGGTTQHGMSLEDSGAQIVNSIIDTTEASTGYGIRHTGDAPGTTSIDRSSILGETNAIYNENAQTVAIGASKIAGGIDNTGSGTLTCVYSYDGNYDTVSGTCASP